MKTFLTSLIRGDLMLAAVFTCLFTLSALAQTTSSTTQVVPGSVATTPAKIGPAPANTPQHHILNGALSAQTRQTLQEAMGAPSEVDTTHPAAPAK